MKTLVLYYSLDGNTRFIAEQIAQAIGADLEELKTAKALPKSGLKYFVGGMQAVLGLKPALQPLDKDPRNYDLLFCGTPTWAGRYASAWHSFLAHSNLQGKKIALFCCHASPGSSALAAMKRRLAGNEIVGEIQFQEPLHHDKDAAAQKAREWAQSIVTHS